MFDLKGWGFLVALTLNPKPIELFRLRFCISIRQGVFYLGEGSTNGPFHLGFLCSYLGFFLFFFFPSRGPLEEGCNVLGVLARCLYGNPISRPQFSDPRCNSPDRALILCTSSARLVEVPGEALCGLHGAGSTLWCLGLGWRAQVCLLLVVFAGAAEVWHAV